MKSLIRTGLIVAFLAPALAFALDAEDFLPNGCVIGSSGWVCDWGDSPGGGALTCADTVCRIGAMVLRLINGVLVPVLFAVAFIVFLYGIANAYIFSHGDPDRVAEGHKLVLWGLIAFAIMISMWGLVNVVANTFGLTGYYAPTMPTSYPPR